jgi:uncharacterized protein YfdQ (DUF2303 family)
MDTNNDMEAVIAAAQRAVEAKPVTAGDIIHLPATGAYAHKIEDLEPFLAAPRRKRGQCEVYTAESFAHYINDHKSPAARIFADVSPTHPEIVGVLNAHDADGPGWHDHRVRLAFRETPEWVRWKAKNNQRMSQIEFAEFVEENLRDIREPAGADMLEVAQTLNAKRDVSFKQGTQIANGQVNLEYNEKIEGTAGRSGNIQIPTQMVLGISPFEGTEPYKVIARFRWRIDPESRQLKVWYSLERLPDIVAAVVRDSIKVIEGAGVPVLYGKSPSLR